MSLTADQVPAYAEQYVGLLLLNAGARKAVGQLPAPASAEYYAQLALILNEYLQPDQPLDADDAQAIFTYVKEHMRDFREHLESGAVGDVDAMGAGYFDGFLGHGPPTN